MAQQYFDSGNRLSMDACAVKARDEANQSQMQYLLDSLRAQTCTADKARVDAFAEANLNLWYTDGYGTTPCEIDKDSALRYGAIGHPRARQMLNPRVFQGGPGLSRGATIPVLESKLQQGVQEGFIKSCDKFSACDFARLMPLKNACAYLTDQFPDMPIDSRQMNRESDKNCEARTRDNLGLKPMV